MQNRFHALILHTFKRAGVTQLTIAKRLGKEPAQINRLLAAAGNWTLNTISDLILAMEVDLDDPSVTPIEELIERGAPQQISAAQKPPVNQTFAEIVLGTTSQSNFSQGSRTTESSLLESVAQP